MTLRYGVIAVTRQLVVGSLLCGTFCFAASSACEVPEVCGVEEVIRRVTELYGVLELAAASPPNPYEAIWKGAIQGMLRQLDPHSVFLDPDEFRQLQELQTSTQKGFGTVVSVMPGRVVVLQTVPGTPSARAGIEPGDEILAINGIPLQWLSVEELVELLSRSRRQQVRLQLRRVGREGLIEVTMTPEQVEAPSVDLVCFLAPGIGYVRVKSFEAETAVRLKQAIEKLGGERLAGLVLDLRDNPGGLMDAALEVASLFLEPGKILVSVRGRNQVKQTITVPEGARPYRFPLVVLVDDRTASGAEIVAAALKDHQRAKLVGMRTYGKGLVQSVYALSEGAGLALTTAYYFTPGGYSIQRPLRQGQLRQLGEAEPVAGGVQPDQVVYPEPTTRLRMALEASGAFPLFAAQWLRAHGPIDDGFEVTSSLLDEFQAFLAVRGIQPSVAEWSPEREWIRSRLKQELFNQALGVERGDQVALERDPQVLKALEVLTRAG